MFVQNKPLPVYASYTDLPLDVAHGSLAVVSTDELQYIYMYLYEIETYLVKTWVPYHFGKRVSGFAKKADGSPAYFNGYNGDTIAAMLARGWTNTSGAAGTVTDDTHEGANIAVFKSNTGNVARLEIGISYTSAELFAVVEGHQETAATGEENTAGIFTVQGGNRDCRLTFNRNGNLNRVGWAGLGTEERGEGRIDIDPFDTLFTSYEFNVKGYHDRATCPTKAESAAVLHTALVTTGTAAVKLLVGSMAGNEMHIKKLAVFELT